MKKRILSLMLSIAVVFSFMPFFTLQADAFSTGAKTLVKTRTVTIKPGKTYKSPKFKLTKKMAIQVPLHITLAKKNLTDEDYNFTLNYKLSLKTAKGKNKFTYNGVDEGMYNVYTGKMVYDEWIYTYNKKISNPGYAKGKYYITIKNTSKKSIKVKFSVKGYTKFASSAKLSKSLTADYDQISVNAGRIGPGIPLVKSIKSSNKNILVDYFVTHDGKLKLYPESKENKNCETVLTVTLKNKSTKYKIKLKIKAVDND